MKTGSQPGRNVRGERSRGGNCPVPPTQHIQQVRMWQLSLSAAPAGRDVILLNATPMYIYSYGSALIWRHPFSAWRYCSGAPILECKLHSLPHSQSDAMYNSMEMIDAVERRHGRRRPTCSLCSRAPCTASYTASIQRRRWRPTQSAASAPRRQLPAARCKSVATRLLTYDDYLTAQRSTEL